jgi:hypothetical protein
VTVRAERQPAAVFNSGSFFAPCPYYEFEINPHGTIYEAFFIWDDAYDSGGYA